MQRRSPRGLSCDGRLSAQLSVCIERGRGPVRTQVHHQSERRPAFGFTLVELLVVIAILGVLAGLILPAVQAARESARRTQCQNNLRQIGIGLSNYESARGELPIGCIGCRVPGSREMTSWNVQLLSYLELSALADAYQLETPSYYSPNKELGATVVDLFLCPSTEAEALTSSVSKWRGQAFSDYGGIYGVEGEGHNAPEDELVQTLAEQWLGAFLYESAVPAAQITDGLSHTVAVAERITRRVTYSEWTNGWNIFAQEKDNPPNAKSGFGNRIGSPHPGGALMNFCDGHVEFVVDTIEQEVFNSMLTKAGEELP